MSTPWTDCTHRDLARGVARWLLNQSHTDAVCWELGGRQVEGGHLGGGGQLDAVGLSTVAHLDKHRAMAKHRNSLLPGGRGKGPKPWIRAVEVKRTRPDLLQDLRAGKLLRYECQATHCYLAATAEALGDDGPEQLTARGLPRTWGVLKLKPMILVPTRWRKTERRHVAVEVVRSPRRLPTQVTDEHLHELAADIARSMAWRLLKPDSPMTEATP